MKSRAISHEMIQGLLESANPRSQIKKINPDSDLFDKGVLDSFAIVQVVLAIEDRLKIAFDYTDISTANFRTIRALAALLVSKYGCQFNSLEPL